MRISNENSLLALANAFSRTEIKGVTLQAPEFDEQERLADAPVEKAKNAN